MKDNNRNQNQLQLEIMNSNFRKIRALLFSSIVFIGCSPSDPAPTATCNTVSTPFQQLATSLMTLTSPIYGTNVSMDLDTHEYTFSLSTSKTVCSIGYQNQGGYTGQYLMKIMQGTTVLYSGNHSFVSSSTVFVPITPVVLTAGVSYKISRTLLSGTIVNHQLGKALLNATGASIPFPVTNGNMTITSSSCYGSGGPVNNWVIPYIDFGTN